MKLSERIAKLRFVRPKGHHREINSVQMIEFQEMMSELAKRVEEQEHRIEMLERRLGH